MRSGEGGVGGIRKGRDEWNQVREGWVGSGEGGVGEGRRRMSEIR